MNGWLSWVAGITVFSVLSIYCVPTTAKLFRGPSEPTIPVCDPRHKADNSGDRIIPLWRAIAESQDGYLRCRNTNKTGAVLYSGLLRYSVHKLPNKGGSEELRIQQGENRAIVFVGGNGRTGAIYVTMRPDFLNNFSLEVFGDEDHQAVIARDYATALFQLINIDQFYRGEAD